jgi:hypothetical protein
MSENEDSNKKNKFETIAKYALESDEVPKIYANGFANFLNNADIGLIIQLNGKPKAVINMSYTLAKTLHARLGKMIGEFENESGHKIMTTDFIDGVIKEKDNENS